MERLYWVRRLVGSFAKRPGRLYTRPFHAFYSFVNFFSDAGGKLPGGICSLGSDVRGQMSGHVRRRITPSLVSGLLSSCRGKCQHSTTPPTRGVDPMCFSGSGHTHFLRWIVYYCVCIQHDIDKSQISFIELCKTLRTNSGLRAINSCLHLFWPELCKAYWVNIDWWQQNVKFSFHQQTVEFGSAHIFTQIYAPAADQRPVHFRLRRVDAAHGYMCRTFRGLCVSACLSVQANSHRRRRTRHRLDCLVVSGGRCELGIRHGQPECDRDTSVTIGDRCKSDWTDQDATWKRTNHIFDPGTPYISASAEIQTNVIPRCMLAAIIILFYPLLRQQAARQ